MPQNATPTPVYQAKSANIVGANAGLAVKAGQGTLRGISINTAGSSSTLVLYDGTNTSGTKLGTWSSVAQANFPDLNIGFTNGLFAVTTGTLSDITLTYN